MRLLRAIRDLEARAGDRPKPSRVKVIGAAGLAQQSSLLSCVAPELL